ncbi:hypothetical protein [Elioraea rosea]|uniref:hypothetical protein n=1 Tax=Elioraea rosea TaxID=2492390 RepID=UPI0013150BF2|nr:hypothetical protein [Elioraea rosea]
MPLTGTLQFNAFNGDAWKPPRIRLRKHRQQVVSGNFGLEACTSWTRRGGAYTGRPGSWRTIRHVTPTIVERSVNITTYNLSPKCRRHRAEAGHRGFQVLGDAGWDLGRRGSKAGR